VVIDAGPKNRANEDTLRSDRRSALNKRLTEPTLLEMSGCATNQDLIKPECFKGPSDSE
jgi:hypothetical protein